MSSANDTPTAEPAPEADYEYDWDDPSKTMKKFLRGMNDVQKSQSKLQEVTGTSQMTISRYTRDLAAKGLADREQNGRAKEHYLTKKGLVKFAEMGLIEPSKNALKDDDVFEAYHIGLNDRTEVEGRLSASGPHVTIERGSGSYEGPEEGLDLRMQHFSERPVKSTDSSTDDSNEEAFLSLDLDQEQTFRLIAGEPLADEFRRKLFAELAME